MLGAFYIIAHKKVTTILESRQEFKEWQVSPKAYLPIPSLQKQTQGVSPLVRTKSPDPGYVA